jgi:ribosomal protein S18 acetylase RimI-like enzyme
MAGDRLTIRSFREDDRTALVALWRRCELTRPWNDPHRDIDRKVAVDDGLLLVSHLDAEPMLVGTVMVGYDGHRGWINYLAVDPDHRRHGIGTHLLADGERRLEAMGCPKVNLMVRSSNAAVVAFYEAHGYAVDDVTALGKRLIRDD